MSSSLTSLFKRLVSDESGVVTVEFVIIFPIFFGFFMMTIESGIIAIRDVMLERGLDVTIRDIRIGTLMDPDAPTLRKNICNAARLIPDCENQLQIAMYVKDPESWTPLPNDVNCIDRSVSNRPATDFTHGDGNQLVVVRACARVNVFFPTSGIGKAIVENGSAASGNSYALVATSSYVVEPRDD
ncbi:Flp pilus assembly protein TadG [Yoonia maritima]|uniref:Flp pilus assembly protein TadG n=1 Tax=Yoonia maritima TaxID=1435347 RepID=A0A2T0W3J6_9RHOB|nr:TadE/TadG family type IV pilus assembly protein [Yoonia maritima]PRY79770.1 Flp pilus assembly protein TadG [Yoonia maritima]